MSVNMKCSRDDRIVNNLFINSLLISQANQHYTEDVESVNFVGLYVLLFSNPNLDDEICIDICSSYMSRPLFDNYFPISIMFLLYEIHSCLKIHS